MTGWKGMGNRIMEDLAPSQEAWLCGKWRSIRLNSVLPDSELDSSRGGPESSSCAGRLDTWRCGKEGVVTMATRMPRQG